MIKDGNFAGLAADAGGHRRQSRRDVLADRLRGVRQARRTASRSKKILADHGSKCESAHFSMKELRDAAGREHRLGERHRHHADDHGHPRRRQARPTMDDVKRAADEYNKIAAVAAKAGIQQGLHNEGFELSVVDGRRTYDILFELLDPELVKFQFQMSTISRGFVAPSTSRSTPAASSRCTCRTSTSKATPARARPAGVGRQGQHRLGEDLQGGEDRRREELLRRAEHGADEGRAWRS